MNKKTRLPRNLGFAVGLLLAVSGSAAAPRKSTNLCVVHSSTYTGNALDTLVFQEVEPLLPGRTVALRGLYFTPVRIPTPFSGTAVMAADGAVRVGIFVHPAARDPYDGNVIPSDLTFSGFVDSGFAGTLDLDVTGDFRPDGTLAFESADCAAIAIP